MLRGPAAQLVAPEHVLQLPAGLEHGEHSDESRGRAPAHLLGHQRERAHAPVRARAAKGCEILNFEGSYLSQFPLVSAHFWTSDHLSSSSRTVNAFSDRIDR